MKYVFGPVPSRRLGKSLGIDPIPLKTCNWNCIYCQLGRTTPFTTERGNYAPRQAIPDEVELALGNLHPGETDWITFVGSGEPTLHIDLGWMIRQVKARSNLPVAVITNGSLLYLPEVREELAAADAILPTLDAGNALLYRRINRAAPPLTFEQLIEGLILFRRMYTGKLWIETMLLRGLNDDEKTLQEISLVMERIQPDRIHITLPIRPPAEAGVCPADESGLQRAGKFLGKVAQVSIPTAAEAQAVRLGELVEIIPSIVTRHPMRESELVVLLNRWTPDEVRAAIQALADQNCISTKQLNDQVYWCVSPGHHGGKKETK